MIGFNALGQLGRLGNQMFQFASLKGIARNNGYQFCFPPSAFSRFNISCLVFALWLELEECVIPVYDDKRETIETSV